MTAAAARVAPAFAVVVAAALHYAAGYALPRPWPDESHFIAPALSLARDVTLSVPQLNAAEGIFWMPTGFYVVQVPLLLAGVDPLAAGRLLALAGVCAFVVAAVATVVRVGGSAWAAGAVIAAWLCHPRVVAMANIARMEGLVLGLAGVCVWLTVRDRWPAALGISLLAPLLHPVGLVVALAVAAAVIVRRRGRPWSTAERIVVAVAAALWVAQALYFLAHADVAAAHLGFQLSRKADRAVLPVWWQLLQLAVIGAAGLTLTARRRDATTVQQALWIVLAMAGGFVAVDVVGREMWYQALGRETVTLLAALVAIALLPRVHWQARRLAMPAVLALAVVAAGIGLDTTAARGWRTMRAAPASRAEWQAFTDAGVAALQRLDASADGTQVVMVDPYSGFGPEVFSRRWRRLHFVQPTPATPLDASRADYLLTTPGAPFVTHALVERFADAALDVSSSTGRYRLRLLRDR